MRKRGETKKEKPYWHFAKIESHLYVQKSTLAPSKSSSFLLLQIKVARDFPSILFEIKPTALNFKSNASNHTSNLETSRHDSRSSFIALRIVKFLGDRIRGVLLYSFIVKSHIEDCTHIYTNQYKLIICYTISWSCDSSFTNFVCTITYLLHEVLLW